MAQLLQFLKIIWAGPNTLIGLAVGVFSLCFGSKAQLRQGCVEFHGGLVKWLLTHMPFGNSVAAMTLGHSILGQDELDLDRCRDHEQVHVRQYERWGILFLPAYFGWSFVMWLGKKDPYFDNPFEVEAYSIADPGDYVPPENDAK